METNALDKAAVRFTNLLGPSLNLDPYMDEEIIHNVKPSGQYQDELIRLLLGEGENEKGDPLPYSDMRGKFEFRKHEMSIWTGFKGHGKSALLSQFFVTAMGRGKKTLIISPEFRPARVLERMLYQRIISREPTSDDVSNFFAWSNQLMWLYDVQASLRPADVLALCRYGTQELGVDHILIDSLMKCGMAPDDYGSQKKFVDKVQNICHKDPVHIHLVAHARKGDNDSKPARLHDVKGASEIADMVENVLSVWRNKEKEKEPQNHPGEPDAILVVEAQRNSDGWIGQTFLNFDPQTILFYGQLEQKPEASYVAF